VSLEYGNQLQELGWGRVHQEVPTDRGRGRFQLIWRKQSFDGGKNGTRAILAKESDGLGNDAFRDISTGTQKETTPIGIKGDHLGSLFVPAEISRTITPIGLYVTWRRLLGPAFSTLV